MSNNANHAPSPDCTCAVCSLLFPAGNCHYCGARATDSFTLYDGTVHINRIYCYRCLDALHAEGAEVSARISPEEFADVRAANDALLAAAEPPNGSEEELSGGEE